MNVFQQGRRRWRPALLGAVALAVTVLGVAHGTGMAQAQTITCPPPTPPAPGQNIVCNGSFEAPALSGNGAWQGFASIPGWTTVYGFGPEIQRGTIFAAADGAQNVELNSWSPSAITQNLATIPGASYKLRFAYAPRGGSIPNNRMSVSWGGSPIATIDPTTTGAVTTVGPWRYFEYTLTATASVTALTFASLTQDVNVTVGVLIDDVSVVTTVVPYTGTICNGGPGGVILPPIKADGTSVFRHGSTVPAKFRVCNTDGVSVGAAGTVVDFKLVSQTQGTTTTAIVEDPTSTTPDTAFRWDPVDQQWIFNINTSSLAPGSTYTYRITLNSGQTIEFTFGVR